ncbi:hypothetical protein J1C56_01240 [Aminobacter anthyllidis]|uniref:Uncharacterized protein n=1 Tax=Aminobacter anthyllidis TaxID=1035067 RepID=A0A9X1A6L6_9HYPH|nr:hypothetical protein [Aminobacter anthyllidis]MBT1154209.1 hypothetical protein [Aminobacter anthyllidis]
MSKETTEDMACPVPTPEEATLHAILDEARETMFAKVQEAAVQASRSVALQMKEALGTDQDAPPAEFFLAVAHQYIFCQLCEADHQTLSGGNPDVAEAIIRSCTGIASTWGKTEQAS